MKPFIIIIWVRSVFSCSSVSGSCEKQHSLGIRNKDVLVKAGRCIAEI